MKVRCLEATRAQVFLQTEWLSYVYTAEGGSTAAGSDSAGGSGSGASAGQGDMRIFSSQILEWIVEYSCDMLFISIRTDASWYRLSK